MGQFAMKRITRSTFKSFIKNNVNRLYIKHIPNIFGHGGSDKEFSPITEPIDLDFKKCDFGITGLSLQGVGLDEFELYVSNKFEGICVSNHRRSTVIAIKK